MASPSCSSAPKLPAEVRGTLIKLTGRGKATIDRTIEAHLANEEELLNSISPSQRRTLGELLRKLLADLEVGNHRD